MACKWEETRPITLLKKPLPSFPPLGNSTEKTGVQSEMEPEAGEDREDIALGLD